MMEGVNSTMTNCKKFCIFHNVPSTTIIKKEKKRHVAKVILVFVISFYTLPQCIVSIQISHSHLYYSHSYPT
jgi:hypothetical protein